MSKPSGKCDICKEKDAEYWYGNTSAATCGSLVCEETMDSRYQQHCKNVEYEMQLEEEMKSIYGGEW